MEKVNLASVFASFSEHWRPKIVGEVNGTHIKVVKLLGEFDWHHHNTEDELFLVTKGTLRMRLRGREILLRQGEFLIVPHGTEHQPAADEECEVVLVEPATTLNTGNLMNERTVTELERLA
ncbi:MAG: cupin domain-containing protein [Bryobacteraceae bacterium]